MAGHDTPRIGTWTLELSTSTLTCSAACRANYGRAPDEPFTYGDLTAAIHEDDVERWRATVEARLRDPDGFDVEYRVRWRDGSVHDVQIRAIYLPSQPDLLMGISVDVTAQRRADERVADAERRRNAMLAATDVATWTWDVPHDRVYADENFQRLFGVSADDANGGPIARYLAAIHPDDRDGTAKRVERAIAQRESYEARYRVRGTDGVYRAVVARGQPELGPDGACVQLPGVVVDVSREVETEVRYHAIFNATEDGFCIIERCVREADGAIDFRHIDINPAFARFTQRPNAVGHTIRELVGDEFGEPWIAIYEQVARTGETMRVERAIGQTHFAVSAFRVPALVEGRIAVMIQDVTVRLAAEQNLRESEAKLKAANRVKDEFLAILGHELRNPLAPIATALHLMQQRSPGVAAKERAVIERQVAHLQRLVDDLLDTSRITSGRVHLERHVMSVEDLVDDAVEMAAPLLEERQHRVSVHVADGLAVLGDHARLSQVLVNLLTNAAKYTDVGGAIVVVANRDGADAVIEVRDNGAGISADMLPRVFDMFSQHPQPLDRELGGLGLGLAIVQRLVELHGGTVSAHSAGVGRGSEFRIRIPAATPTRPRADELPRVVVGNPLTAERARRVLIVDDNSDAAELLGDALRLRGHDVRVAPDGRSALDLLAQFTPEVAVLDLGLPTMDGFELARQLRARPGGAAMRIVALTGYGQPSDFERTREAGFDAHIVKPLPLADLHRLFR